MTNLDLIKFMIQAPATIWAFIFILGSALFFGMYIGWSVKFIGSHWNMVSYPEFEAHRDGVAERLEELQRSIEGFKGDVFKVLAMRRTKGES